MTKLLKDLFERCEFEEMERACFEKGEVRSLAISTDKKTVICQVYFEQIVSVSSLKKIEKKISKVYKINRMRISPRYNLKELCESYVKTLKERLYIEIPSARGMLTDSVWNISENNLVINVSETAMERLKIAFHSMKDRIYTETGFDVKIITNAFDAKTEGEIIKLQNSDRENRLKNILRDISQYNKNNQQTISQYNKKEKNQQTENVLSENIIYGKFSKEKTIPIKDIMNEYGQITIEGEIFFIDNKEINSKKTGKEWVKISFDITDNTNSIRVSKFLSRNSAEQVVQFLKTGSYIIVQGKVTYDTYEKENIIDPTGIILSKRKIRMDTAHKKRVELHLHTNMSAMDGISSAKALIQRAKLWGHSAIAITDHGVVQAYPDAMNAIEKNNIDIKVLYGVEAYYVNDFSKVCVVRGDKSEPLSGEAIVFDLETTGLKPLNEEITEIAAVLVRDGQIIDSFQTYVNPNKQIPKEITELTGISNETVKNAPQLKDAIYRFLEFVGDRYLVAHNAGFDMAFLNTACEKLNIVRKFTYIDTLEMSRILMPDLNRYKLNILAKALNVGPFEHHRASEDATVLAKIWCKLIEKFIKEYNISNISEINTLLSEIRQQKSSLKNLKRYHLVIIVKNRQGLRNLYKLISYSFLNHFHKKPLIPRSELIKHREGLILGCACEAGEVYSSLVANEDWSEIKKIASFYDYLEIQPIANNRFLVEKNIVASDEELKNLNRKMLKLADEIGILCCATGDVHFLEPEDEAFRRILMAGQGFHDADKQAPLYFKTTDEMLDEFSYLGEQRAYEVVVENTNKIADMCEKVRPVPKESYPPKIEGADENLRNMSYDKAKRIYGDPLPEIVKKRLDRELNSIINNNYAVMYIIAQKLVTKSLEDGYLVGSRGSVGSSFAAFTADITEVNSLAAHYLCPYDKYIEWHEEYSCGIDLPEKLCPKCGKPLEKHGFSIPFETFLGFEGDKVPDIDLNFSGEYQPRIHKYTGELFGNDKVFRAGTIGTVAEKTAYGYVKKYMDERGITCSKAEENRLTAGCTGVRKTSGQHPGGIVVVPEDVEIYDFCPVQHPADDPNSDIITTHFDYHSIDENLLKLDELGHDDPTIIKHMQDLTGVDAQKIPLDDKDVISLFTSNKALKYITNEPDAILGELGCLAVPEFGTKFVRGMVAETKPKTFSELVSISGLSHGTDVWLSNAQDLVRSGIPLSECICCRDDIMNYLILKGVDPKLSFTIMESVRKGKGLKQEWEKSMREQNVPDWYINSCNKIKYMFPKAHAVAYVMMAFRIAWFKVHKPLAFYSAYFSIRAKGFDASCMILGDEICVAKIRELQQKERDKTITAIEKETATTLEVVHEFYKRGFNFECIDIYKSEATTFLIEKDSLVPPFISMPGVGEQAAQNIVDERKNGKFLSAEEIMIRCNKVSKSAIDALKEIGALGDMPTTTQISLF